MFNGFHLIEDFSVLFKNTIDFHFRVIIDTLKEISPRISLEGMMLKLKLHYFGHLMRRVDSLEKTLMLGGIGGRRRARISTNVLLYHIGLTRISSLIGSSFQMPSLFAAFK